jgi:ArsR family transcriptional regulator
MHAEVCRSISHPKRLEILSLLRDGERSVSELAEMMGLSSANVSQQLSILRNSGVVDRRRDGTMVYYGITHQKILRAYDLMTEDLMTEVLEQKIAAGVKALGKKGR